MVVIKVVSKWKCYSSIVIASEAKQSRCKRLNNRLDCFVASLLAMTNGDKTVILSASEESLMRVIDSSLRSE